MGEILYLIILSSELDLVNFDEIMQVSPNDMRYNKDRTKTIIKWLEEFGTPQFITSLSWFQGPYTNDEIYPIIKGTEWI